MKITTVILPSVEEQRAAGDTDLIDPEAVKTRPDGTIAFKNFNYALPEGYFGKVTRTWIEDGRLMGEIEIPDDQAPFHAGVAGFVKGSTRRPDGGLDITDFQLMSVGITQGPRR